MFFQNSKGEIEFAKSPNRFDHKKSFLQRIIVNSWIISDHHDAFWEIFSHLFNKYLFICIYINIYIILTLY